MFYILTFHPTSPLSPQIEHLKRQDTSAQLREARDHLSTSQEELNRLKRDLSAAEQREGALKTQLTLVEQQWKQRLEQVMYIILSKMAF